MKAPLKMELPITALAAAAAHCGHTCLTGQRLWRTRAAPRSPGLAYRPSRRRGRPPGPSYGQPLGRHPAGGPVTGVHRTKPSTAGTATDVCHTDTTLRVPSSNGTTQNVRTRAVWEKGQGSSNVKWQSLQRVHTAQQSFSAHRGSQPRPQGLGNCRGAVHRASCPLRGGRRAASHPQHGQ